MMHTRDYYRATVPYEVTTEGGWYWNAVLRYEDMVEMERILDRWISLPNPPPLDFHAIRFPDGREWDQINGWRRLPGPIFQQYQPRPNLIIVNDIKDSAKVTEKQYQMWVSSIFGHNPKVMTPSGRFTQAQRDHQKELVQEFLNIDPSDQQTSPELDLEGFQELSKEDQEMLMKHLNKKKDDNE